MPPESLNLIQGQSGGGRVRVLDLLIGITMITQSSQGWSVGGRVLGPESFAWFLRGPWAVHGGHGEQVGVLDRLIGVT